MKYSSKKFPVRITDYVKCEFIKGIGTVAVVHENSLFPFLDLTSVSYKGNYNLEEMRHYFGYMLCHFLRNHYSRTSVINDYWLNQYIEKEEIIKNIDILIANVEQL